jgi:hypothetical protein
MISNRYYSSQQNNTLFNNLHKNAPLAEGEMVSTGYVKAIAQAVCVPAETLSSGSESRSTNVGTLTIHRYPLSLTRIKKGT